VEKAALPELVQLTPELRGLVVGLALLRATATAADSVVGVGDAVAAAGRALSELPREQRAAALAELAREAVVPANLEAVHPSWIADALAGEPSGLVLALAEGAPLPVRQAAEALVRSRGEDPQAINPWSLGGAAWADLLRLLLAPVEALTVAPSGPLGQTLAALSEAELLDELARWGARTLGLSLVGAPLAARARAMASAGMKWAAEIAAGASADVAGRDRARSLVARAAVGEGGDAVERLRAVGVVALGGALALEGSGSVARVAGRLPVGMGRALIAVGGAQVWPSASTI
jgi:hypothetical protein